MRRLALLLMLVCMPSFAAVDDAYTTVLFHFDGNLTDESGKTWTAGGSAGEAIATTGQSVFGGSSLYLGGSDGTLRCTSTDFDLGSGDFTFDWWEYRTGNANASVITRSIATTDCQYLLNYYATAYMATNADGNYNIAAGENFGTVSLDVWSHRAVTRSGNTFRTFKNGQKIAEWTSAASFNSNANPLYIGVGQGLYFKGYIDEMRFSKGIARWTADFTPPTSAYGPAPVPTVLSGAPIWLGTGSTLALGSSIRLGVAP